MSRAQQIAFEALSESGKETIKTMAAQYFEREEAEKNAKPFNDEKYRKARKKAKKEERRKVAKVLRSEGVG